jgi:hypothetical protein
MDSEEITAVKGDENGNFDALIEAGKATRRQPGKPELVKRGRRPANESRAAAIRARLLVWKQTPESQRISLRALAGELGTSHQLLSSYLRGWDKWQQKEYPRKANDICDRAGSENRPMTFHEQRQAEAYRRAPFQLMIDSLLSNTFSKLQRDANAGKLSMGQLEMLKLFARKGYPGAQEILQNVLG